MSITALHLYEQLTEATDDKARARIIAEAFGQLEEHYPNLKDVATQTQVRETELLLQKEIKEVEAKLQIEIRQVEAKLEKELKEVEAKLEKEIKEVEAKLEKGIKDVESTLQIQIKEVEVKIAETRSDLIRWVVGVGLLQTSLITGVLLKVAHLI
jgi:uncharacterized protein involved in exopolysaccharide biosynthesis